VCDTKRKNARAKAVLQFTLAAHVSEHVGKEVPPDEVE
jgi:hypothetical protein